MSASAEQAPFGVHPRLVEPEREAWGGGREGGSKKSVVNEKRRTDQVDRSEVDEKAQRNDKATQAKTLESLASFANEARVGSEGCHASANDIPLAKLDGQTHEAFANAAEDEARGAMNASDASLDASDAASDAANAKNAANASNASNAPLDESHQAHNTSHQARDASNEVACNEVACNEVACNQGDDACNQGGHATHQGHHASDKALAICNLQHAVQDAVQHSVQHAVQHSESNIQETSHNHSPHEYSENTEKTGWGGGGEGGGGAIRTSLAKKAVRSVPPSAHPHTHTEGDREKEVAKAVEEWGRGLEALLVSVTARADSKADASLASATRTSAHVCVYLSLSHSLPLSLSLSLSALPCLCDPRFCRARSKRRGFSPGAAPRHSQSARVNTDFFSFFCHIRA